MAYRSVALYRWVDDIDDVHLVRLGQALDRLGADVPAVRSLTHGSDTGALGGHFDYIVVIDVNSASEWRILRDHPSYVLLVEEFITNHVVEQATGQLRVDDRSAMSSESVDLQNLTDDELLARARGSAQTHMNALMAEPDEIF